MTGGRRSVSVPWRTCVWLEQSLPEHYHIDIVDLLENPRLAAYGRSSAVPTLVRQLPLPIRKVVGGLSDTARLLTALQLPSRNTDMP